jgi:hypothetical protein
MVKFFTIEMPHDQPFHYCRTIVALLLLLNFGACRDENHGVTSIQFSLNIESTSFDATSNTLSCDYTGVLNELSGSVLYLLYAQYIYWTLDKDIEIDRSEKSKSELESQYGLIFFEPLTEYDFSESAQIISEQAVDGAIIEWTFVMTDLESNTVTAGSQATCIP